ncbi:MAG: AAA family ATPase [Myxococcota bacterium]
MSSVETTSPAAEQLLGLRRRIESLLTRLDRAFLEREVHTRLALLSMLSGHHLLMLGPPGTAKSLLARAVCQCVADGRYFEYLLSRFTHPDELFGPVSIPGLKEEDYRRLTVGYLPDAHVAFLDEVFKANSAILNSLLTLINERVFHHGTHRDAVPLLALLGASNEAPETESLSALYDRFLVRVATRPLARPDNFLRVSLGEVEAFAPLPEEQLTLSDIATLRSAAHQVTAGPAVRAALLRLRAALQSEEIPASDRRWRQAMELVRMAALTDGRDELGLVDLLLLQYCFGTPFDTDARVHRQVCREIVVQAYPSLDPQPLRDAEAALSQPVSTDTPLSEAKTRRVTLIDQIAAQDRRLERAADVHGSPLLTQIESTLWLPEVPPEVFTALLVARNAAREVSAPLRERAERYRPQLLRFDPVGHFFGPFALQTQLQGVFSGFGPGGGQAVAMVTADSRSAGLGTGGVLLTDLEPASGADLPQIEISADFLFDISRSRRWRATARDWMTHTAAARDEQLWEALMAALTSFRKDTSKETFPLFPGPDEEAR